MNGALQTSSRPFVLLSQSSTVRILLPARPFIPREWAGSVFGVNACKTPAPTEKNKIDYFNGGA